VTSMSDEEWKGVQEALVIGGLRACIDDIIASRQPGLVLLSDENRRLIEQEYDDGDDHGITIVPGVDPPWFVVTFGDSEVCQGVEHEGTLYTIAHANGDGLVSVIVGKDLCGDETGVSFPNVVEAKTYVEGLTAK